MEVAVVAGADPGHALPAIGVAAQLVRRGHGVRLHTGAGHAATAAAHGLALTPLPDIGADEVTATGFGERLRQLAVALAPRLVTDWRSRPPDVVVVDSLTWGAALAAQRLDRPWVELIGHHLPDPDEGLPPVGLGRSMPSPAWRRRNDRRLVARQRRSIADGATEDHRAIASLGLDRMPAPCARLVATLPVLERVRHPWPSNVHVVGPLAVDPVGPVLQPPEGSAPLVVVTDSTASGVVSSLGALARHAFDGCDLRVAVTSSNLPATTTEAMVVGRGPHGPLLAEAAIAIGHGGGGFLTKAAAAGVPAVIAPLQGDQREAAARWREVGAGRVIRASRLTPRRLRWAVVRHLADRRAHEAAARLAAEARWLGAGLAATIVEQVGSGQAPAADGAAHHLAGAAASVRGRRH